MNRFINSNAATPEIVILSILLGFIGIVAFLVIKLTCDVIIYRNKEQPKQYRFKYWLSFIGIVVCSLYFVLILLLGIDDTGVFKYELAEIVLHFILPDWIANIKCNAGVFALFHNIIIPAVACLILVPCHEYLVDVLKECKTPSVSLNQDNQE